MKNQINGRLIHIETGFGIPNADVRAWDKDSKHDDFIGQARTNKNGEFSIGATDTYIDHQKDELPDLYFEVLDENGQVLFVEKRARDNWSWDEGPLVLAIPLDLSTSIHEDNMETFSEDDLPVLDSIFSDTLLQLGEIADLTPEQTTIILSEIESQGTLPNTFWESLAEQDLFEQGQIAEIQGLIDFVGLGQGEIQFAQALKNNGNQKLEDLIDLTAEDWQVFIQANQLAIPANFADETAFALHLEDQITAKFPNAVFQSRFKHPLELNLGETLNTVQIFLSENPFLSELEGQVPDTINWGTNSDETKIAIGKIHTFSNLYYELGVHTIFLNQGMTAAEKLEAFQMEVMKLDLVFSNNPEMKLDTFDFVGEKDQIKWSGIASKDRTKITRQLMVMQRVFRIAPKYSDLKLLLSHGLNSSAAISAMPLTDFKTLFPLQPQRAEFIYNRAKDQASKSMLTFMNLRETMGSPHYNALLPGSVSDDLTTAFENTPGFNEIFEGTHYCGCESCQSLYAPAAYLTDLLRFTDKHITTNIKNKIKLTDQLFKRRPDLLSLELNCENSYQTRPFTEIINEILERRLIAGYGNETTGKTINPFVLPTSLFLGDAVVTENQAEGVVVSTQKERFYEKIAKTETPTRLPYNLWVDQIRAYVGELNLTPADLLNDVMASTQVLANEQLHLTPEEVALITRKNGSVTRMYGMSFSQIQAQGDVVGAVTTCLGVSFDDLVDLLRQGLSAEERNRGLQQELFINATGESDYVRIEGENLLGLTAKRLNRMYRFVRLAEKLDWEYAELDQLMRMVGNGFTGELDTNLIQFAALVNRIKTMTGKSVHEVCGLVGYLDRFRMTENVFNAAFNSPFLSDGLSAWSLDKTVKVSLKNSKNDIIIRLATALQITAADAHAVLKYLAGTATNLNLNETNFKTFYSLGSAVAVFGISGEYLLKLLKITREKELDSPAKWLAFSENVAWSKSQKINLEQLDYVLNAGANNRYKSFETDKIGKLKKTVLKALKVLENRLVGQQSNSVVNTKLEEEQGRLILAELGDFFNVSTDHLKAIFKNTQQSTKTLVELFLKKENGTVIKAIDQELTKMALQIELLALIGWSEAFFISVVNTNNGIYNKLLRQPTLHDIRELSDLNYSDDEAGNFIELLTLNDTELPPKIAEFLNMDKADVTAISAYWLSQPGGLLHPKKLASLGALSAHLTTLDCSVQTILELAEIQESPLFGTGVYNRFDRLRKITSNWRELLKASAGKKQWPNVQKKVNRILTENQKEALINQALWNLKIKGVSDFRTTNDLYEYLLIDVEMSGCAQVSPIKEAILAVQVYIQRCQTNLESGVNPETVPKESWEWMKNYRVWEANRKVFLYPENYIEPELRDNKTPLFKQLEDELLQSELSDKSSNQAILQYISDLEELSKMKTVSAYHDKDTNVIHQVSKNEESGRFFYRKCEIKVSGLETRYHWTAWEQINLNIVSQNVTVVYAFDRPYLFWLDNAKFDREDAEKKIEDAKKIKPSTLGTSGKKEVEHVKVLVKSSFLSSEGWTKPKTVKISERYYNTKPHLNRVFAHFSKKITYTRTGQTAGAGRVFTNVIWLSLGEAQVNTATLLDRNLNVQTIFEDNHFVRIHKADGSSDLRRRWTNTLSLDQGNLVSIEELGTRQHMKFYYAYFSRVNEVSSSGTKTKLVNLQQDTEQVNLIPVIESYDMSMYFFELKNDHFLVVKDQNSGKYEFIRSNSGAVEQLYDLATLRNVDTAFEDKNQLVKEKLPLFFDKNKIIAVKPHVDTVIDFSGAFGIYFRELFFHVPFLIANRLNQNQRFKESQKWYHYIFNPLNQNGMGRKYWNYSEIQRINKVTLELAQDNKDLMDAYRNDPFQPHVLARLRPAAYQRSILMKYIDNLLDWADKLFAQDTWESINEASLLYVLSWQLLGKKPELRGSCETTAEATFEKIKAGYKNNRIPDFMIELENRNKPIPTESPYPDTSGWTSTAFGGDWGEPGIEDGALPPIDTISGAVTQEPFMYENLQVFCIPENKDFSAYWDRIADRLYKVRNCLNSKGVKRQLALFEAEIDPRLLVKWYAHGGKTSGFMSNLNTPTSHFRFSYLLDKAKAYTRSVQQFGSTLLSAFEKGDNEELQQLVSSHQLSILIESTKLKRLQVDEATEQIRTIERQIEESKLRLEYTRMLIYKDLSSFERNHLENMKMGSEKRATSSGWSLAGSIAHAVPNFNFNFAAFGLPTSFSLGGSNVGAALSAVAQVYSTEAAHFDYNGNRSATVGGHDRRKQEWGIQEKTLRKNIEQLEAQLQAASLRHQLAINDLDIHEESIEQQREQFDFYREKFTSRDLYQWMENQLSGLFFQSYKLAYELAKKAENAYRLEQNEKTADSYINFGHWENSRRGLLAGERLEMELNQLERAYLEKDERELEIEKIIPLSQLTEQGGGKYITALENLIQTGKTTFNFDEMLFDMDYPGHIARKIRSISISIPAIIGPYETIKATLTQLSHKIRYAGDGESLPEMKVLKNQQIAISSGVNDSGMFELNFRGERYLAFEQTGAISKWELNIPHAANNFDFNGLTDVIVKVQYTAIPDTSRHQEVVKKLNNTKRKGFNVYNLKNEDSTVWYRFMNPGDAAEELSLKFTLKREQFPFNLDQIEVNELAVLVDPKTALKLKVKGDLTRDNKKDLHTNTLGIARLVSGIAGGEVLGDLEFSLKRSDIPAKLRKMINGKAALDESKFKDLTLLVVYQGNMRTWPGNP